MRNSYRAWFAGLAIVAGVTVVIAQQPQPGSMTSPRPSQSGVQPTAAVQSGVQPTAAIAPQAPPPVAPQAVAATVNGQPIPELAVARVLKHVPPDKHGEARPDIINSLIDTALIDQFLAQQKVVVDRKEIDAKLAQIKDEVQKQGGSFDTLLREWQISEPEMIQQIDGQLRWEKYAEQQSNDKILRDFFQSNKELFDGSMVHARHILLENSKQGDDPRTKLLTFKQQIEAAGAEAAGKVPANADKLTREQARARAVDEKFAAIAAKESACPSRAQGGDLGEFPRGGSMVEPFARAAFALQPYQMSDVVATPFGHHLILVIGRKPGKDVKFDDIKDVVKDVYAERLRQDLAAKLRSSATIVVK